MTVQFVGGEGQTFTVVTDAATGIGRFTFRDFEAGPQLIELNAGIQILQFSEPFMVFAGFVPTSGVPDVDPNTQQTNVFSLGQNALPATDVPATWPTNGTWGNAVPWMTADGLINSLGGATRTDSLEAGPFGLFQQLGRGGHGVLPQEELPPPKSENNDDEAPQVSLDLDEILDTIARSIRSREVQAKPSTSRPGHGVPPRKF